MRFGSLFAGIGGFDLGFERAGFECAWQVEIDDLNRGVLAKHWPNVRRHDDVKTFPPKETALEEWRVDVVIGGFPCQDISQLNFKGKGIEGERSGLWFEFARLIRLLRPAYVVAENVPAITSRGLDRVLWSLAECGYDAEWQTVSAQMLGAPHIRERIFIVAYPSSERLEADEVFAGCAHQVPGAKQEARLRQWPGRAERGSALPDRIRWCPDRELCRVVDGVPDELHRYFGLGNAVVPQCAEWVARRLMEFIKRRNQ